MANELVYVNQSNLSEFASELTNKYKQSIFATKSQAGSPVPIYDPNDFDVIASSNDRLHTYVYLGTTTSAYIHGHLYYWVEDAWVDGGVAIVANPTLQGSESELSSIEIYGEKYKVTDTVPNDAVLDIQANGTSLGTFSADASTDVTINITAQDLGITSPMDFVGVSTTDPQVDGATVVGHTVWVAGEVVLYQRQGETGYEEYVNIDGNNTSASWELLGDASSYALNSIEILAGTGLTGGGDLTQNRTLSLADNYGDTKNPYASKSANLILASPNGESGTPTFRALTATDIPTLASNNIDDTQSTTHKFVNQAMWNYLDNITYIRPAVSTFALYNNGSAVATTIERGTILTVNQIRHNETEIDNISSLKFKTGSTDIQDVTPVSSATTIELNSPISISATTTYTLSGVNTRNETFSKSATVSVYDYAYTTVNSSATTPTTGLTKQSITSTFATNGASITYSANDYIYIYVLSSGKKMYQNIMGQWVEVPAESLGAVVITRANGTTGTYYAYRLGPMLSGGTDTFRVS